MNITAFVINTPIAELFVRVDAKGAYVYASRTQHTQEWRDWLEVHQKDVEKLINQPFEVRKVK